MMQNLCNRPAFTPRLTDVDVFMDCQPAIIAPTAPKPQSGQYLLATFHVILARLLRKRGTLKVRLHWVPAHVGIAGNEAVDGCAKEAAQGASSPLSLDIALFKAPLPISKAASIASGSKAFAAQWLEEWRGSVRFTRISAFDNATPSKVMQQMYGGLTRPQCSVLTQLRTGHIGLNAYLHRFKLAPSPLCPHCPALESVPHFLLSCPAHRAHRLRLMTRLGTARLSLRSLLSAKSEAAPVLAFVRDTGRLPAYAL